MRTLVMKFGGAAIESPEGFARVAEIILKRSVEYDRIVVVTSAMGNLTDQLLDLARQVHPNPPRREQDMLVSVGERISISLLAMALILKGKEAISFTGSQSGIITDSTHSEAQIIDVRPKRLFSHLDEGKIVIVAGFQGVSREGEITTLGRGGSDTTAVALAIALNADKVEFLKDVAGIYGTDPKKDPAAPLFPMLRYEEALKIVQTGAKILHPRSILLAARNELPLHVLSFHDPEMTLHRGTWIGVEKRRNDHEHIYEA
jgi:aspartate kinase